MHTCGHHEYSRRSLNNEALSTTQEQQEAARDRLIKSLHLKLQNEGTNEAAHLLFPGKDMTVTRGRLRQRELWSFGIRTLTEFTDDFRLDDVGKATRIYIKIPPLQNRRPLSPVLDIDTRNSSTLGF